MPSGIALLLATMQRRIRDAYPNGFPKELQERMELEMEAIRIESEMKERRRIRTADLDELVALVVAAIGCDGTNSDETMDELTRELELVVQRAPIKTPDDLASLLRKVIENVRDVTTPVPAHRLDVTGKTESRGTNIVLLNEQRTRIKDGQFPLLMRLVVARLEGEDDGVHKMDMVRENVTPAHPDGVINRLRDHIRDGLGLSSSDKTCIATVPVGKIRLEVPTENIQYNKTLLLDHHIAIVRDLAERLPDLSLAR